MIGLVTLWSHLLAAALFGGLTILQLRHWNGDPRNRPLITAFATMSVWAIFLALLDRHDLLTALAESARNLAFLAFLYGVMPEAGGAGRRAVKAVYAAVAAVVGLQIVIGGVTEEYRDSALLVGDLLATGHLLGLTIAAGSLILVHNVYGQAAPASRAALKFPMLALAGMWGYELHLYTVAYFAEGDGGALFALRGLLLSSLVPLFALGTRQRSWKVQISRAATFQSLSVIAILFYLVTMMSTSRAMQMVGGDWAEAAQLVILVAMSGFALLMLVSARMRGWARVTIAKHMFAHRYDYRTEWLRFTDTVRHEGEDGAALEQRVVKALADIGGSPSGILLMADSQYRLTQVAEWNWDVRLAPSGEEVEPLARFVEARAFVLDFDGLRAGLLERRNASIHVPAWLAGLDRAWAGIPLIHAGRLVGLVILGQPAFRRALDWEDIDLFRAAGFQAASYIAEARSQQALADSRRFDEFNRRFAFILHDIKNLVSQLSLVARNAERHSENPEFRADMIATLQASVKKLNDLMARLSPGAARESDPPRPVEVRPLIEAVVAAKGRHHPIRFSGDARLVARADRTGLEQALAHLVQNAIDASPLDRPVTVTLFESGGDVAIEICDRGAGMTEEFVRTRLFQPFVSTKKSGFGIGAYEARALVAAMGGHVDVESHVGEGTRFTLIIPAAELRPENFRQERMRA